MGFTSIEGLLLTRGGLVPGTIIRISQPKVPGLSMATSSLVKFMFNPNEYTIARTNTFKEEYTPERSRSVPVVNFEKPASRELSVTLFFDTYPEGLDVRLFTAPLFNMMDVEETSESTTDAKKYAPPQVAFVWGGVFFPGYLTSVSEKFTLFAALGLPMRSEVTIKIKEIPLSESARMLATAATATVMAASALYSATKMTIKMSKGAILASVRADIYSNNP